MRSSEHLGRCRIRNKKFNFKGWSSETSKHLRIKEKKIKLLDPLKTSSGVSEVRETRL